MNYLINRLTNKLFGIVSLRPKTYLRGNVLLSYDTTPFLSPSGTKYLSHSNQWECAEVARLFLERGYAVDVIKWDNVVFQPKKKYVFVIDIHQNLARLGSTLHPSCIKIMHVTAKHWLFQNKAEYERLFDLQKRRGVTLLPRRIVPPANNIEGADYVTILGDSLTQETYAYAQKPFFSIPISATTTFDADPGKKDFARCRNGFLWLGGGGAVLKGLDLVLEYFSKHPEYQLTICGSIKAEPDFEKLYFRELYETPNIKTLGKTNIASEAFAKAVHESIALIFPSASESQSGSVVTAMHAGLIPIVSKEAGVPVLDFGITLESNTVFAIENAIKNITSESNEKLSERAHKAWENARSNYTKEAFTEAYSKAVDSILKKRNL